VRLTAEDSSKSILLFSSRDR